MTNAQRLAFIQYQLEMLRSVVKIANELNKDENINCLYTELRKSLGTATQMVELIQQS